MATAADRGWPIRELSKADLFLVSTPMPTPAERAAGVLTVPGFPIRVRREVGPLFRGFVRELQGLRAAHGLSPLLSAGGYNFRPIRGYEAKWAATHDPKYLSNHSWAFAVDLCVPTNPMGLPIRSDFPRDETYALAAKWGLSWGREWSRPDPQHFEFIGTPDDARRAVAALNPTTHLEDFVAQLTDDEKARFMRAVDNFNRTWDEQQTSKVDGKTKLWLAEALMFQEANVAKIPALLQRLVDKIGA